MSEDWLEDAGAEAWQQLHTLQPEADDVASFRQLIFGTLAQRRQLSLSYAELSDLVIGWHRARLANALAAQPLDTGATDAQG